MFRDGLSTRKTIELALLALSISLAWVSRPSWSGWLNDFLHLDLARPEVAEDVYNATLGFQRIFCISLPTRSDRQRSMQRLAQATDLDLVQHDGVPGESVLAQMIDEARPTVKPAQIGCWLAHVRLWKRIIRENLQTALVLEDDLDWDLNIHPIAEQLSRQMAASDLTFNGLPMPSSPGPYALDWDVLYLGACYDIPRPNDTRARLAYFDPLGPAWEDVSEKNQATMRMWGIRGWNDSSSIRVIAPSTYPTCTMAYAVTAMGARKLLDNLGGRRGVAAPVDLSMIGLLREGNLSAYTVVPPLFTPYRFGDERDSDIVQIVRDEIYVPGWSENLRISTRRHIGPDR
ncbi:MAG: hypothetical protein M1823_006131 [Watsoniomyces obsoletus]|nr:MAG: hypothetical protein M1823_006131 [Watsoniomyces obsoletus]